MTSGREKANDRQREKMPSIDHAFVGELRSMVDEGKFNKEKTRTSKEVWSRLKKAMQLLGERSFSSVSDPIHLAILRICVFEDHFQEVEALELKEKRSLTSKENTPHRPVFTKKNYTLVRKTATKLTRRGWELYREEGRKNGMVIPEGIPPQIDQQFGEYVAALHYFGLEDPEEEAKQFQEICRMILNYPLPEDLNLIVELCHHIKNTGPHPLVWLAWDRSFKVIYNPRVEVSELEEYERYMELFEASYKRIYKKQVELHKAAERLKK